MQTAKIESSPKFVVRTGTRFMPIEDLPKRTVNQLHADPGDVVVDIPDQRSQSRLLCAKSVVLLRQFLEANTVEAAALSLGQHLSVDPRSLFDEICDAVQTFIDAGLLEQESSRSKGQEPRSDRSDSELGPGDRIGAYRVLVRIRAAEDTAVYQAVDENGDKVAIKIANAEQGIARIQHEISVLEHLPKTLSPPWLGQGSFDGMPYFVTRWIEGGSLKRRAAALRTKPDRLRRLKMLLLSIAHQYSELHEQGIIHGDVRSSNLLIDENDHIFLNDFGFARRPDVVPDVPRAFDLGSLEPEAAGPFLEGAQVPITFKSEQYALGILFYELISGHEPRTLMRDKTEVLLDIQQGLRPPALASLGIEAWPAFEKVIDRMLAKQPGQRFSSLMQVVQAVKQVPTRQALTTRTDSGALTRLTDDILAKACDTTQSPRSLYPGDDRGSVYKGAAGLAWLLHRAAIARQDVELSAQADRWTRLASRELPIARPTEITSDWSDIAQAANPFSIVTSGLGPHLVSLHVALSRNGSVDFQRLSEQLVSAFDNASEALELFHGRAGILTAAASLSDADSLLKQSSGQRLFEAVTLEIQRIEDQIQHLPPIGKEQSIRHLGMAHGWAGITYALIVSSMLIGRTVSDGVLARLDELSSMAIQSDGCAAWPGTVVHIEGGPSTPDYTAGWCSGSAGHVFNWLEAFRATGEQRYRDLAIKAGRFAINNIDRTPELCCGIVGRAFALLKLYQATGDVDWLTNVQRLISSADFRLSDTLDFGLFRGHLGLAALSVELEVPAQSRFPLIDPINSWN